MAETSIEWTDATWNPVAGCTILTAGCTNCYAMRMAARLQAMGVPKYEGLTRKSGERHIWTGKVTLDEAALEAPKGWRKPRLIFVNSMSDLFQDAVPVEFIRRVWATMAETPQHTYQILTKRPDRMAEITPDLPLLPNVWLGTSVENAAVLHRLDFLRATPAAVRFVSYEPLIGSVAGGDLRDIHWAIVGGESGPRARPMLEEWIDEIYGQCEDAGAAFFFKQWAAEIRRPLDEPIEVVTGMNCLRPPLNFECCSSGLHWRCGKPSLSPSRSCSISRRKGQRSLRQLCSSSVAAARL